MASELGWAFIKGGSIAGTDGRILVKNGGQALAVQGLEWNTTTQTLSLAAASSEQTAINITTGTATFQNATVSSALNVATVVATGDITTGTSNRNLSKMASGFGRGNQAVIDHVEVIPENYKASVYNFDVATNGTMEIQANAIIAIEGDFPSALS
jgi:hypothetical protein